MSNMTISATVFSIVFTAFLLVLGVHTGLVVASFLLSGPIFAAITYVVCTRIRPCHEHAVNSAQEASEVPDGQRSANVQKV